MRFIEKRKNSRSDRLRDRRTNSSIEVLQHALIRDLTIMSFSRSQCNNSEKVRLINVRCCADGDRRKKCERRYSS